MMTRTSLNLPVVAALAALLTASPVLAQGKGNGHGRGHDRDRVERRDDRGRDRDDDDDRRWDRRRSDDRVFSRRSGRRVPPGWCRGVGNPHRTRANCGYHTDRIWRDREGRWRDRYGDVIRRDGIYRDRDGVLRNRDGRRILRSRTSTSSTYEARHRAYHEQLRRSCADRARNASLLEKLRIDRQCDAEHDAWHRRAGRSH